MQLEICLSQIEYTDDYYLSNLNSYSSINSDFNILTFNKNYWFDNQIQFRYNAKIYYGNYFKSVIGIRNRFIRGFQWEKNLFNFRNQNINLPNTTQIKGSFTLNPRDGLLKQIIKTLRYSSEYGGWINKNKLNKGDIIEINYIK